MVPILEAERDAGRRTLLNATFGREAQLTDARLADPDDFFGRFARVVSARQIEAPTRFDTLVPIGSIPEGEQLHVLVRTLAGTGQAQTQRLVVVTLRRSGGGWKVSMAGALDDLVASLRGRHQARTGPRGAGTARCRRDPGGARRSRACHRSPTGHPPDPRDPDHRADPP